MKSRITLCISAVFALMMIACSSYDEPIDVGSKQSNQTISEDGSITIDEAVRIADNFRGRKYQGRSAEASVSEVMAVTNSDELASKVSKAQNDTLAYIVNYANDGGFVIVSSKQMVNPVLAFSDEGNFSIENEIANECFVKRIGDYLAQTESVQSRAQDEAPTVMYEVEPLSPTYFKQSSPYNKYLEGNAAGTPIGCVPVAAVNVMVHCSNVLNFQGRTFYMKGILNGYAKQYSSGNSTSGPSKIRIPDLPIVTYHPNYTFEQARDSVARLMSLVSYRLVTSREGGQSYANSIDAYNFLDSIPNIQLSTEFMRYNWRSVVDYLVDDNIVFVDGDNHTTERSHNWIIDGCTYWVEDIGIAQSQYIDYYMHCDWGWGGKGNGYYRGDIFEVKEVTSNGIPSRYSLYKFFAAKINNAPYAIIGL